jgi:hypothetical protein
MNGNRDVRYTIGLDLGQARNHTALAVLERTWTAATAREFILSGTRGFSGEYEYLVVGMERLALGTSYPMVVEWVKTIAKRYGEDLGEIVVDATGVGSAVMDLLKRAQIGARIAGVVITGSQATGNPSGAGRTAAGYSTVSRTELLTALQVSIQSRRISISLPLCSEWAALQKELELLRMAGKRAGVQDDLAFALALAVWWGVRI